MSISSSIFCYGFRWRDAWFCDSSTSSNTVPSEGAVPRRVIVKVLILNRRYATTFDRYLMKQDPRYYECPVATCSYGNILKSWERAFTCWECNKRYCITCHAVYRRRHICAISEDERENSETRTLSEAWLKQNAKVCPRCGVQIRKEGGCDSMRCEWSGSFYEGEVG